MSALCRISLDEAAFSSGEQRTCIDLKVAIVLPRERKAPLGFVVRAEHTFT